MFILKAQYLVTEQLILHMCVVCLQKDATDSLPEHDQIHCMSRVFTLVDNRF